MRFFFVRATCPAPLILLKFIAKIVLNMLLSLIIRDFTLFLPPERYAARNHQSSMLGTPTHTPDKFHTRN
jgi:hypothetical protein